MKQYKARDKITQKMSRDGAIEVNEAKGTKNVSASGRGKPPLTERRSNRRRRTYRQYRPRRAAQHRPYPPTRRRFPMRWGRSRNRTREPPSASLNISTGRIPAPLPKKAARKAQAEAESRARTSRLQFTEEERATPELKKYIRKSDKAADRLDEARAKIPKEKKLVKERTFDEATGKGKTRLRFEEREKPQNYGKAHKNPLSRPVQEAGIFVHNKVHSVEKDNSGVEGAHKSEELAEKGAKYGVRKVKEGYRSHKLKAPTGRRQRLKRQRKRQTRTTFIKRHSTTTRRSPRPTRSPGICRSSALKSSMQRP